MATKIAILLMVVVACMAFPSEELPRPPHLPVNAPGRLESWESGQAPLQSLEPRQASSEVRHKEGQDGDLKTENTFWWGGSYYPAYYRSRYVVYPQVRSSYYYSPYWSSWW